MTACGSATVPPASGEGPLFGFADTTYRGAYARSVASHAGAAGARVMRVGVSWQAVQPSQGGPLDWSSVDDYLQALRRAGVRPLLLVHNAPAWARDPMDACLGSDGRCPPADARLGDWSSFVEAAVRRYRGLRPVGVEVWNEQNHPSYWRGRRGPDPVRYARMLRASRRAVLASGVETPVIVGGLVGGTAAGFLQGLYEAGAASDFDAIGFHVYPEGRTAPLPGVEELEGLARDLRAVRDANGDSAPLWLTEVGLHTGMPRRPGCPAQQGLVSEEQQAQALLTLYDAAAAQPDIAAFLVFRLRDDESACHERGWGVMTAAFRPKEAYVALRKRFEQAPTGTALRALRARVLRLGSGRRCASWRAARSTARCSRRRST